MEIKISCLFKCNVYILQSCIVSLTNLSMINYYLTIVMLLSRRINISYVIHVSRYLMLSNLNKYMYVENIRATYLSISLNRIIESQLNPGFSPRRYWTYMYLYSMRIASNWKQATIIRFHLLSSSEQEIKVRYFKNPLPGVFKLLNKNASSHL